MKTEDGHVDEIQEFCNRTFSGRELLEITDELGVGVGATIDAEKVAAMRRERTQQEAS